MNPQLTKQDTQTEFLLYKTADNKIKIEARLYNDTIWLPQKKIAELFGVYKSTISEHINNIFQSGELSKIATVRNFRTVQKEGTREVQRDIEFYNLDAILSVGYRVNSKQATGFRIWATKTLKEYIIKGFVLNDERFKTGNSMQYFDELQERIREIRISERFFYQKIKDIYITSIDYDKDDEQTILFFKKVQNKLLWAVSKNTAAELVYNRIDIKKPLLGMSSFDKENKKITKKDITIGKNYLTEDEIKLLGLIVEQYLSFAQTMAQQKTPMYMSDWIEKLDGIIKFNGRELLENAGVISHKMAQQKSAILYEKHKIKETEKEKLQSLSELEADIKTYKMIKN
ncbi:MAG: cell filamentation protein Fic [Gammaproteobacteria bacterium]|nr:MAG: cell filamentation protein Fic [Gammaproteobacteria bacterium]